MLKKKSPSCARCLSLARRRNGDPANKNGGAWRRKFFLPGSVRAEERFRD
jgi:hypothetical protein